MSAKIDHIGIAVEDAAARALAPRGVHVNVNYWGAVLFHLLGADPATVARAKATHGQEAIFFPRPVTLYLAFRADRPPFDDVRVRRAFVHERDEQLVDGEFAIRGADHAAVAVAPDRLRGGVQVQVHAVALELRREHLAGLGNPIK